MTTALNGWPASRVAIVTGGSRGVGGATVRRLAARGYAVVVNYLHDQVEAEVTVEAILAGNSDAMAVRADVADELDVQRLFAETITAFGAVDVVVHTASGRLTASPVIDVGLDEFDALVRLNTRATFVVNREAGRCLRGGGAIINVSSSATDSARGTGGLHTATRAFTNVLTRALALELRERDITVNAVSPAVHGPCQPERVTDVIAYLLSDHGRRLTGHILSVDDDDRGPGSPPDTGPAGPP